MEINTKDRWSASSETAEEHTSATTEQTPSTSIAILEIGKMTSSMASASASMTRATSALATGTKAREAARAPSSLEKETGTLGNG